MIDIGSRDIIFSKYDEYVASFMRDGVLDPMSELKFEHSRRVAKNARLIADYNGFTESMVVLAEVCGLLHDIGRYRQLQEYGTFNDLLSINHGECGYEVLLELGWLDILPEKSRECVLTATRLHNGKTIPDVIDDETILIFLKLVRDSDKLDIYYVLYDALKYKNYEKYPQIVRNLEIDVAASRTIVNSITENPTHPINYNDAKSLTDFLLIAVQWSYDLHSFGSYKIMLERQLLEKVMEIMPGMDDAKISGILYNAISNVRVSLEDHMR